MPLRDRGSFNLPFLRINWSRRGLLRYRLTSYTWHIKVPILGSFSKNRRFGTGTEQTHWDHPGPGWWEGKRR